jgi:hypothetical protein
MEDRTLSAGARVWTVSIVLALGLTLTVGACGTGDAGDGGGERSAAPPTTAEAEDLDMKPEDFRPLRTMTRVRGFFIDNRLGHLQEALRVANSPQGGVYPVGTIVQLVPQEAMVKRRKGWSPQTNDWEFFFLRTSATGTEIETRGAEKTVNRFGGNCFDCHSAAEAKWDMLCEQGHGCMDLPIGRDVIRAIQDADPRPS